MSMTTGTMLIDLVPERTQVMKPSLTNEKFLDELTNLFLLEGMKGLTIGEMAARLHCSRRRLYEIAPTKEEIFGVIMNRYFRGLLDEGEALLRDEQDPVVALAAYLDVGVRSSARVCKQLIKDVEECDATRTSYDAYQRGRATKGSQLIDEGVRQGVFVECQGAVVSELMLLAARRLRQPAFLDQANLTLEEAFREFYRVMLGGLLVRATVPDALQRGEKEGRGTAPRTQKGDLKKR